MRWFRPSVLPGPVHVGDHPGASAQTGLVPAGSWSGPTALPGPTSEPPPTPCQRPGSCSRTLGGGGCRGKRAEFSSGPVVQNQQMRPAQGPRCPLFPGVVHCGQERHARRSCCALLSTLRYGGRTAAVTSPQGGLQTQLPPFKIKSPETLAWFRLGVHRTLDDRVGLGSLWSPGPGTNPGPEPP